MTENPFRQPQREIQTRYMPPIRRPYAVELAHPTDIAGSRLIRREPKLALFTDIQAAVLGLLNNNAQKEVVTGLIKDLIVSSLTGLPEDSTTRVPTVGETMAAIRRQLEGTGVDISTHDARQHTGYTLLKPVAFSLIELDNQSDQATSDDQFHDPTPQPNPAQREYEELISRRLREEGARRLQRQDVSRREPRNSTPSAGTSIIPDGKNHEIPQVKPRRDNRSVIPKPSAYINLQEPSNIDRRTIQRRILDELTKLAGGEGEIDLSKFDITSLSINGDRIPWSAGEAQNALLLAIHDLKQKVEFGGATIEENALLKTITGKRGREVVSGLEQMIKKRWPQKLRI